YLTSSRFVSPVALPNISTTINTTFTTNMKNDVSPPINPNTGFTEPSENFSPSINAPRNDTGNKTRNSLWICTNMPEKYPKEQNNNTYNIVAAAPITISGAGSTNG